MSGWSMGVFGAITLVAAFFGDMESLILGVALLVITVNELRGGRMLRDFRPGGARLLGWNQIALAVVIMAYAAWSMVANLHSHALDQVGSTGDPEMDRTIGGLKNMMVYGVYGTVLVVGGIVPALTSWYYFSRGRLVHAMLAQTPVWVIEAIRAAG